MHHSPGELTALTLKYRDSLPAIRLIQFQMLYFFLMAGREAQYTRCDDREFPRRVIHISVKVGQEI